MWLATIMLFAAVGKRLNSPSQMFYKIDALKNLVIFTGKHYKLYYNKLYLKDTPTQVFSREYCEKFKYNFFIEHLLFHYILPKFYVMSEFFRSLWVKN